MNPSNGESVCGKCGYIVKGLTTLNCPECGSDLRDVGIVSPAHSAGKARFIRLFAPTAIFLVWTAVCVALYVIFLIPYRAVIFGPFQNFGGMIDKEVWPNSGFSQRTVSLFPVSAAFRKIALTENMTAHTNGCEDSYRFGIFDGSNTHNLTRWEMDAALQTTGGAEGHLMIDLLHGLKCRWTDAAGKESTQDARLNRQVVLDWFKSAGIDIGQPSVQREAAELLEIVKSSAEPTYWGAVWSAGTSAPVGRLERIVLKREQNAEHARAPMVWSDRSGSEQQAFGPSLNINWISIPFIVLLWGGGLRLSFHRFHSTGQAGGSRPASTGSRMMTIMFTDIVGYTARSSLESRGGLLALIRRKRELVAGIVQRRHGRIVKTLGDGLLIAFDSATDAVLAGLEIQSMVAHQNSSAADVRDRFELRIAISTGEVAQVDDDVYGEAVNLASRVQQLARAGEVWFTGSTLAMLNKAEVSCEFVGAFDVKGVADAVPVHRAQPFGA